MDNKTLGFFLNLYIRHMRYINIPYYFLSIFVNLPKAKLNYYGIRGLARVLEMYMLKKKSFSL